MELIDVPIGKVMRAIIHDKKKLAAIEQKYRLFEEAEIMPLARGTGFIELTERVVPDRDGDWKHPIILYVCRHRSQLGALVLCREAKKYLEKCSKQTPMDILSVSAGMNGDSIVLLLLVRTYKTEPNVKNIYNYLDEFLQEQHTRPKLIVPDEARKSYTEQERMAHKKKIDVQNKVLMECSDERPFLNSLDVYTPLGLDEIDVNKELIYDLQTKDMQISTVLPYVDFIKIFRECMRYITSVERDFYYDVIREKASKEEFINVIEAYIEKHYIDTKGMKIEDMPSLMEKINRALFELYIVQDLIDDPEITDVKITAPDSIRVRVKGRAYLSNVTFIDSEVENEQIFNIVWDRKLAMGEYPQDILSAQVYEYYENSIVLFGHTISDRCAFGKTDKEGGPCISRNRNIINLDCGCAKKQKLGCLRLEDFKEFYLNV